MSDEKHADSLARALGEIRQEGTRAPRGPQPAGSLRGARPEALDKVLLEERQGSKYGAPQPRDTTRSSRAPLALGALARQSAAEPRGSRTTAQASRQRLMSAAGILGVVLFLAMALERREDEAPGPAAASFEMQVRQLGLALDAYRQREGHLPARLSLLPEFPREALEWPFTHYRLRVLVDRPEFFLVPEAVGGYLLIGRYRGEAWVYTEASARPLRRLAPE